MSILSGLFSTLLVALMLSGADKVMHPMHAAGALVTAGVVPGTASTRQRASQVMARLLGIAEVGLGVGVAAILVVGDPSNPLRPAGFGVVAAAYLGFAWFLRRVDSISPGASCGCFGADSVTGPLHILANLAAAFVSVTVAVVVLVSPPEDRFGDLAGEPASAMAFAVVVGIGALMFLLTPSLVTNLQQAKRGSTSTVPTFTISEQIRP